MGIWYLPVLTFGHIFHTFR